MRSFHPAVRPWSDLRHPQEILSGIHRTHSPTLCQASEQIETVWSIKVCRCDLTCPVNSEVQGQKKELMLCNSVPWLIQMNCSHNPAKCVRTQLIRRLEIDWKIKIWLHHKKMMHGGVLYKNLQTFPTFPTLWSFAFPQFKRTASPRVPSTLIDGRSSDSAQNTAFWSNNYESVWLVSSVIFAEGDSPKPHPKSV